MANEKQLDLIARKALLKTLDRYINPMPNESGYEFLRGIATAITEIEDSPAVDAVVLPCKIGDDVYIIPSKVNFELNVLSGLEKYNRVYHQKVAEIVFTQDCWYARGNADKEFGTGRVLPDVFYKKNLVLDRRRSRIGTCKDGWRE